MTWSPHLIDLTRPMTRDTIIELAGKIVAEDSPYNAVEVSWLRNWDTDNGTLCQWTLNDHFGTHLDAPIHTVPHGASVDKVDIDRLIGEAVVIDCSFANGRGLTGEDFERAKPGVQPGDIVLIYSAEQAGSLEDFVRKQTYVTPDGATWLVKKGIKAVGVEPFGFEHLYEGLFVHKYYEKSTPPPHWPAIRGSAAPGDGPYCSNSLDVIEKVRAWGPAVILSDGDVVFQPRKIQRSGLWDAVGGQCADLHP